MKARRKGTNEPFKEIESVELKGVCGIYFAKDVEFEQDRCQEPCKLNPEKDLSNPIDHWQDVRERAAIAAMHAFCVSPSSGAENITLDKMAQHVVKVADAFVEKLKRE